jgi:alpha-mannosidase
VNVELEYGRLGEADGLLDDAGQPVPLQKVQSWATANGRNRISFIADLPPMGYSTYFVAPDTARQAAQDGQAIQAGDDFMENRRFRLEFDPQSGAIRGLFDKAEQAEVFCGLAAVPAVLEDPSDTWSHNVFQFNREAGRFTAKSVRLVECGPVKAVIRVVSEYGASRLIQDFTMYPDLDPIEVHATLDWREQFKVLKLRFPLNLSHMRATYEIPYGHKERFAGGEEEPGQSWVDLSGMSRDSGLPYGFSLLNDGKYSFDVNIRDIGLTVLRSPIYAHHIPAVPDPEGHYTFIDQGLQRFSYALLPHSGSWEAAGTVRRAAELNLRPIPLVATYHPDGRLPLSASFASVNRENILVSVLKQSEQGDDLVIRCVETSKEATRAEICLPHWHRAFEAEFGPCEIKTFRIPRDRTLPVVETNLLEWSE